MSIRREIGRIADKIMNIFGNISESALIYKTQKTVSETPKGK